MSKRTKNINRLIKFVHRYFNFMIKMNDINCKCLESRTKTRNMFCRMYHIDSDVLYLIIDTCDREMLKRAGQIKYNKPEFLSSSICLPDNQIAFLMNVDVSDNKLKRSVVEWAWKNRDLIKRYKTCHIKTDCL